MAGPCQGGEDGCHASDARFPRSGGKAAAVRILLLEDDATFAGLVRANLERTDSGDYSLEWVSTLAGALERLESGGFDLVISDFNLPDSKGLETLESLVRATDRLILVLTGEQQEGLRQTAIEYGAYDLMSKDHLDRAELERLVRLAAMQAKTFAQHKQAQETLRASEERFRSLNELSSDWYWSRTPISASCRWRAAGSTGRARRSRLTSARRAGKCHA